MIPNLLKNQKKKFPHMAQLLYFRSGLFTIAMNKKHSIQIEFSRVKYVQPDRTHQFPPRFLYSLPKRRIDAAVLIGIACDTIGASLGAGTLL